MTTYPKPSPPTYVLPQVGAILHLDTELSYPAVERGNKHWMLDGSCVLLAPDRILTVRHTLGKSGKAAAFFPYEGILPIGSEQDERVEDYDYGDSVCLCRLEEAVRFSAALRYDYVSRKKLRSGVVAGYGTWDRVGWEADGLQRSAEVQLHMPGDDDRERFGGNLDVCWWSPWNDGLKAERNNSGGPVLLRQIDGLTLVGLSRETKRNQQVASRIADTRRTWLDDELEGVSWRPLEWPMHREPARPLSVRYDHGVTESFPVPEGAKEVRLTLSATPGLRLQMGIAEPGEERRALERLRHDDESSGRFLYRREKVPAGASSLAVAVVAVAEAPARVESVDAQLCCLFA